MLSRVEFSYLKLDRIEMTPNLIDAFFSRLTFPSIAEDLRVGRLLDPELYEKTHSMTQLPISDKLKQ